MYCCAIIFWYVCIDEGIGWGGRVVVMSQVNPVVFWAVTFYTYDMYSHKLSLCYVVLYLSINYPYYTD